MNTQQCPVSNNLILVYKIPDVLTTLGISQMQLMALTVVSKNDYHRNIYLLGPTTNFSIIKEIGSRPGNIVLKMNGNFFLAFSAKYYFTNRVLILITFSF